MPKNYSQEELFELSRQLGERLNDIINRFELDLIYRPKMWVGKCPIHGGDNESALNLYHTGKIIGNWYCRTHQCERIFKSSIIGFIRGLLSHNNGWRSLKDRDKIIGFAETLRFAEDFLGGSNIKIDKTEIEKRKFAQIFTPAHRNGHTNYTRQYIRSRLKIPAQHYINRGFTREVLDKYDVGLCDDPAKPFYNRVVFPVYHDDYSCIVGYTARTIFSSCDICGYHHSRLEKCPNHEDKWRYAKWLNNKNFERESYLYNHWFAKEHIKQTSVVVLTESPGNVLRLVESGINNVVGIFGTSLTKSQKFLVDCSGSAAIYIVGDNDDPGENSVKEIKEMCQKLYCVESFDWQKSPLNKYGDVGEIPKELVIEYLVPQINDFCRKNKL